MEQEGGGASAWTTPFLESPCDFRDRDPSPTNIGTGVRHLPLGIRTYAEMEGVLCGVCIAYSSRFEVAERGGDGESVCGPQIQFYYLPVHPIPYDFLHMEKHFSKTKFTEMRHGLFNISNIASLNSVLYSISTSAAVGGGQWFINNHCRCCL
jgi:hypothetical protein